VGAREYLAREAARGYGYEGWTALIDVLLRRAEGGDVHGALLRMDSIVRPLPLPHGFNEWLPMSIEVQNLALARLLAAHGEQELALQAIRRRPYVAAYAAMCSSLPEYLREEGRLAAALGDTAGAIEAYEHYLALREDPDPPWRAQWDSVKSELAAIVAR
jgi:tetratricopeptide (TPR) repeat protein